MEEFAASIVVVDEIDGELTVALADDAHSPTASLLLVRAEHEPEPYYVEWNDQSRACYGGLERVDFDGVHLVLTPNDQGRTALRVNSNLRATVSPEIDATGLRIGLRRVFDGTNVLHCADV